MAVERQGPLGALAGTSPDLGIMPLSQSQLHLAWNKGSATEHESSKGHRVTEDSYVFSHFSLMCGATLYGWSWPSPTAIALIYGVIALCQPHHD